MKGGSTHKRKKHNQYKQKYKLTKPMKPRVSLQVSKSIIII